ncbi:MAG: Ras-associating protein, partial [Cyanobacteriota bacterium erpe_2018_sw_39hr_WHONDRS-SW48-000098_B_bin.30]|nr:Ras-associating protein [Cyanobacteriota bacterium erpe_2018_sw_39hr_WHONDRS-SW48-000098_B_bin.30]
MTETPASQDAQPTLTLEGEDGHSYQCEFLDRFEFEGNEYALLLKVNEDGTEEEDEDGEQSLVIMRCFERGADFVFQT